MLQDAAMEPLLVPVAEEHALGMAVSVIRVNLFTKNIEDIKL